MNIMDVTKRAKQFIVRNRQKSLFSTEILRWPKYLYRIEIIIVCYKFFEVFEVLCK